MVSTICTSMRGEMFKRIETEWIFDCQGIMASRFTGPIWMYRIYSLADGRKISAFWGWIFRGFCKITRTEIQTRDMTPLENEQWKIAREIESGLMKLSSIAMPREGTEFSGLIFYHRGRQYQKMKKRGRECHEKECENESKKN